MCVCGGRGGAGSWDPPCLPSDPKRQKKPKLDRVKYTQNFTSKKFPKNLFESLMSVVEM